MQEASALVSVLVIIAFVGGLSLLAHWGRKNRGAEISLVVIVLFLSFLVTGLGAVLYFVGSSGAVPSRTCRPSSPRPRRSSSGSRASSASPSACRP
ncbi:hypothetical protein GBA65_12320 [Rubrobacter marinus]|uniref:Uncharacterized protein n=1 Tax=Rubrobacter marinus TaxID=2653852 RepID=A0A6G8PY52_9ACTN|nr:hypothetical protein [Rubrobacter marinus]QIN79174.1 hypothetical protein GBA65_12320 [Rubrobacter marinus]